MMKVFVDSDVILDFLLNRELFIEDITDIFERSYENEFSLYVSPITITNVNYIIGRIENKTKANLLTRKILKLVKVDSVGQSTINKSISSNFKDFEDGVQNFCAQEADHKIIVTRNVKDYKTSALAILTPREFLSKLG